MIALYGHNVAETQTVLWMRMLDRLAGPNPPKVISVDPRETPVARAATVHLGPLPGTNVALMNGLLHELIRNDWVDHDYFAAHTGGYQELMQQVEDYPVERVAAICPVPAEQIREAARIVGTAHRLLSTVLQGFYQSHQATAAAVQVNNINIIRGMLGKPGAGVLQMNGQPTAENTRECGADGDLPGFRNWANDSHVAELARIWNLDQMQIPHYAPPTHLMQMMRYVEQGTIRFLWVSATNPAVSLPELSRIRSILSQQRLFLVVQDIFPTETTELADVVLPAATWGEKTGTFTNADRTVHLSDKAVEPPGAARPDLDIFLDYARRMDFRDKDGAPLPAWQDAESAFEAWKQCSAGRPCDYTGLSYAKLRGGSGIQWPCTAEHPEGTERLYADGQCWATPQLWPGPGHRGTAGAHRVSGDEPRWQGGDQGCRVPAGARDAQRRVSAVPHHRADAVSLPHQDQDRAGAAAAGGGAAGVGGDVDQGRGRPTASARATWWRSAPPAARSAVLPGSVGSATVSCSCRFTTATGTLRILTSTIEPPTS